MALRLKRQHYKYRPVYFIIIG